MTTTEPVSHVQLDQAGVAWIDDTNVKVVEIIQDHLSYGHTPEEIQLQHPHLTLAQVHAAFAYYYDHQESLDAELARRLDRVRALRAATPAFLPRGDLQARMKNAG